MADKEGTAEKDLLRDFSNLIPYSYPYRASNVLRAGAAGSTAGLLVGCSLALLRRGKGLTIIPKCTLLGGGTSALFIGEVDHCETCS